MIKISENPPDIIFVCTGNIFRSFCAERALRALLPGRRIYSRGIEPAIRPHSFVLQTMEDLGLTVDGHEPTLFATAADPRICIAMNKVHQDVLAERFSVDSVLYQSLAVGQELSILDINEALHSYELRQRERSQLVTATVRYLVKSMPRVAEALKQHAAP